MSFACFSSIAAGLSIKQSIILFSGNILLPLAAGNWFSNADVTTTSLNVTNMTLYNGTYTISNSANYAGWNMGNAFGNVSGIPAPGSVGGWYSQTIDTPNNLSTFQVIDASGVIKYVSAVWLQMQFPYKYSYIHSYNMLSLVSSAFNKGRSPRIFHILGSNNNTKWYNLHYVENPITTVLPREVYNTNRDMSSNNAVIRQHTNFNYIRMAILDSYETGQPTDRPVLVSQFYVKGNAITTFNSQQLFYRFNSTQITGGTNLGNFATETLAYDASLSNSNALSVNNTLSLSTTGNVTINKIISTDASGISFSFSMKMADSSSYTNSVSCGMNPIFDFGNGPGTDSIIFGTIGNKIYTNITSGNTATSGTLTFGNYTTPFTSLIGSESYGVAVSQDEKTVVYVDYNTASYYISKYTTSWSSFQVGGNINSGNMNGINMSADGKIAGVIRSSSHNKIIWFATLNTSTGNYNSITEVDGTPKIYVDSTMSIDGSKLIAVELLGTSLYYSTWNGTTFSTFSTIAITGITGTTISVGISNDGNKVTCATSNSGSFNLFIFNWNGSTYTVAQNFALTHLSYKSFFSNNNNILFIVYSNNVNTSLVYTKWNGTQYNSTLTDASTNSFPLNTAIKSAQLTFDETAIYSIIPSAVIYRTPLTISNSKTNSNVYTTAINDNTWRDYLWRIEPNGNYIYYVNGIKVYDVSGIVVPSTNRTLNYIGKSNSNPGSYFVGEIDNFRMHNRVIGVNELIDAINNIPNPPLYFHTSAGNTSSVTLSFIEPAQPVNFYDISATSITGNTSYATISAPVTSYTFSSLPADVYNVEITARNVFGRSNRASINISSKFFDSLSLYYRFKTGDITSSTFLGNYATGSLVYDASLSASGIVPNILYFGSSNTSTNTNAQFGGNVVVNKQLTNTSNGLTISFSLRGFPSYRYRNNSNSNGMYPIFDFGNGPGNNSILFGVVGNKIYSSVTSGNTATSGTLTFGGNTNPTFGGNTTIQADSYGIAVSMDEKTLVYVDYTAKSYYYSRYTTSWSAFQTGGNLTTGNMNGVDITSTGRIVGVIRSGTGKVIWFADPDINGNYSGLTEVNGTGSVYIDSSMPLDGNRIVAVTNNGTALRLSLSSGITYNDFSTIAITGISGTTISVGCSNDGTKAVVCANSPFYAYIFNWTGSTYGLVQTLNPGPSVYCFKALFTNDNNRILFFLNRDTSTPVIYTNWTGTAYNTSYVTADNGSFPLVGNIRSAYLTFDQTSIYTISADSDLIYRTPLTISNSQTHINFFDTSINDNIIRNYAWTISNSGTYTYYVNGVQIYQVNGLQIPIATRTQNFIGRFNLHSGAVLYDTFRGQLTEFTLHNRVLSSSEVAALPAYY